MGSQDNGGSVPTTNLFSIRNYVLGTREQDIRDNWPFPEKYLEVCLKHGIKKLLPPFKCVDYGKHTSDEEAGESSCTQEGNTPIALNNNSFVEINKENGEEVKIEVGTNLGIDDVVSELTKQMSPLSLSTDKLKQDDSGLCSCITLHPINMEVHVSTSKSSFECPQDHWDPPTKCLSRKRKKHGKKLKKRLLADIYAETSPHTLQALHDVDGSTSGATPTVVQYVCARDTTECRRVVHEIKGRMEIMDQNNRHIHEESLKLKHPKDVNEEESVSQGGQAKAITKNVIS